MVGPSLALNRSTSQTPTRLTFEEFLARDCEHLFSEWVDGEVIDMYVNADHQRMLAFLFCSLSYFVEERDLGIVFGPPFAMRCQSNGPVREPDILFMSHATKERIHHNWLEGPADLVIEIIMPDSRKRDRETKFREYAEGGVLEYWMIDPARKQAEFYGLKDDHYVLLPIDELGRMHCQVVPGLWLETEWLSRRPLPKVNEIIAAWQSV